MPYGVCLIKVQTQPELCACLNNANAKMLLAILVAAVFPFPAQYTPFSLSPLPLYAPLLFGKSLQATHVCVACVPVCVCVWAVLTVNVVVQFWAQTLSPFAWKFNLLKSVYALPSASLLCFLCCCCSWYGNIVCDALLALMSADFRLWFFSSAWGDGGEAGRGKQRLNAF